MKVVVTKASEYKYMAVKEFNSLEELFGFIYESGHSLVIAENMDKDGDPNIITEYSDVTEEVAKEVVKCDFSVKIYDDWLE